MDKLDKMENKRDFTNKRRLYGVVFNAKENKYEKKHRSQIKEDDPNLIGLYITEKGQKSVCQSMNFIVS